MRLSAILTAALAQGCYLATGAAIPKDDGRPGIFRSGCWDHCNNAELEYGVVGPGVACRPGSIYRELCKGCKDCARDNARIPRPAILGAKGWEVSLSNDPRRTASSGLRTAGEETTGEELPREAHRPTDTLPLVEKED
ncbi:hypothetical protein DL764_002936 [Monosporascus ibericus]|uniref:WSC domain-containing protein n=1 Tax=Monosporascus ibericus TaxID=155417 RepID=A0A4Q4TL22_9PEZI|nr:hypothetical protein DL764_002936 [Monosporascus ibericus]